MYRDQLVDYLQSYLTPADFADYCPNGLQVAGREEITQLVTGVTANQSFIDQAITAGADLCLVHHGFFWKGENPCIVGMKHRRLTALLCNDLNLVAYHLPLDAHPEVGNNAQLAKRLGFEIEGAIDDGMSPCLTLAGHLQTPLSGDELAQHIGQSLGRQPLHIPGKSQKIERVAWCTGAAQDFMHAAVAADCDAYITGEVSERTVDIARESGIHFYAAGHYATEQFGVQALGEHLADRFGIQHTFIPVYNPA